MISSQARPASARIAILLITILLALVSLPTPRVPSESERDTTADASWSAVLGFAHQRGLQFGTDIVFTYGPLGFLATPFVANDQIGLRLLSDALLSLATGAGITLLAWRLQWVWRCVLLGTAFFLLGNISPRNDLLTEASLVSWGLLTVLEDGRNLRFVASTFVLVATFAALVKITLLIMAIISVGFVMLDFLLRGQGRISVSLVAGFAALSVLGWIASGQNLLHLGVFITRGLSTSQGYNQAMGYEGSLELRWRGAFTVLAAAVAVSLRSLGAFDPKLRRIRWRRVLLSAWLLALLFLVWKHGFVRNDLYHAGFYFGFVGILVLLIGTIPTPAAIPRLWGKVSAVLCWFACLITTQAVILPGDAKASLAQPFNSLVHNAANLAQPAKLRQHTKIALAAQRDRSQLPRVRKRISHASVDMFGCDQLSVLCNELNYSPRPVFQSYAAYNAPLMLLNEQFYLSSSAPEYVLFALMPMDRKFPPLEDAFTLRHLLTNYEPADRESGLLLLKQRARTPAQMKLLTQGTARIGEPIPLALYGNTNLWMELQLHPTIEGRLRELFYQSAKVRLTLWYGSANPPKMRRFRAPAPMLSAGFLLSPLLLNNDDVLRLYHGDILDRPGACSLELNRGDENFWQAGISFRIFQVETELGRCSPTSPGTSVAF